MTYSVKELFYTLQGEGAQTGRPAVFCRFAVLSVILILLAQTGRVAGSLQMPTLLLQLLMPPGRKIRLMQRSTLFVPGVSHCCSWMKR